MNALQDVFTAVLNMSITASYVSVGVILIRLLLRKAPKIFSYILWAPVLLRLVFPFSFVSVFSFLSLVKPVHLNMAQGRSAVEFVPRDIGQLPAPAIQYGAHGIGNAVNAVLPQAVPAAGTNPMQIWIAVLSLIWITGVIAMLIYSVVSYVKIRGKLQTATLVEGNVFETDAIGTALVCGFIHPKIYVPVNVGEVGLPYLLEHERTHIRRRDYLIKPLAFFSLSLHWVNPLMWLSFLLMSRDMEMSCDESVLRRLGAGVKGGYAGSLLSLSVKGKGLPAASPLAFGESHVAARIKNALRYKKPAFWVIIASVVILSAAVFLLLANPQAGRSYLTAENVKNMSWTAEQDDNKQAYAVDQDEWGPVIELINTASRSRIPERYRPTFDELYPVYYTLSVEADDRENPESTTYMLLLYHHKDWDIFHGEYEYKLALTRLTQSGESDIWGLPYSECRRMLEWFRKKSEQLPPSAGNGLKEAERSIGQNIDIIMSSPLTSSNPQDYIDANRAEYNAILAMDAKALPYMFSELEKGGQTGLKGQIMEGKAMATAYVAPNLLNREFETQVLTDVYPLTIPKAMLIHYQYYLIENKNQIVLDKGYTLL